ncbi:adenosylcobinamide amidohydrolase [Kiloniella laminariae]|uniref:Adenosylcobinamide amidohydrolase n=1 Tax=Kiloniella laminariae TaxID=454162 RepID=A0ABT4LIU2_9PROT|nr:adenosylcobinamide amidohydrolase [Kiloniella laminariae]MCZ4280997.1 adenosylcobinamide amidohydrolase [Kiloniella laminariae]
MPPPFEIRQHDPWLDVVFPAPQRMLSWALVNGGYTLAREVCWLQVSNADLPPDCDPVALLQDKLQERDLGDAVGLMTSRQVRYHHIATEPEGEVQVSAVMTLGLSNALSVKGETTAPLIDPPAAGTINLLCHVSLPLNDQALLEASSIATQARTAALLEFNWIAPGQKHPTTGTGTDCIVISCPTLSPATTSSSSAESFAGLHTDCGKAIGKAVYNVTREAALTWFRQKNIPLKGQKLPPAKTGSSVQTLVSKPPPL